MKDEDVDRDELEDDADQIASVEKLAPADVKTTYLAERYATPHAPRHRRFHPWLSALAVIACASAVVVLLRADIIGAFMRGGAPVAGGSTGASFILATLGVFGIATLLLAASKTQSHK